MFLYFPRKTYYCWLLGGIVFWSRKKNCLVNDIQVAKPLMVYHFSVHCSIQNKIWYSKHFWKEITLIHQFLVWIPAFCTEMNYDHTQRERENENPPPLWLAKTQKAWKKIGGGSNSSRNFRVPNDFIGRNIALYIQYIFFTSPDAGIHRSTPLRGALYMWRHNQRPIYTYF